MPTPCCSVTSLPLLGPAAVAGAGSALVLVALLASPLARRIVDTPNARSMHTRVTPRIGGLGLLAGVLVAVVVFRPVLPAGIWLAAAGVFAVSLVDDVRDLPASLRLALQLIAAGIVVATLAAGLPAPVQALLVLALAWMVNLFNFMDGLDGLAGGQAAFGFGTYAVAAALAGDPDLSVTAAIVAGAAVGFLCLNFAPARVFLGDAGSTTLGLLAGALGLAGVQRGLWPPAFPVVAFLPFVFDATATLADRLRRRQRVWVAHREHAYQRLGRSGVGHARTSLAYYALMTISAGVALHMRESPRSWLPAACLAGSFALLYVGVQVSWHRRQRAAQGTTGRHGPR